MIEGIGLCLIMFKISELKVVESSMEMAECGGETLAKSIKAR